jgi:hypothetical protein
MLKVALDGIEERVLLAAGASLLPVLHHAMANAATDLIDV